MVGNTENILAYLFGEGMRQIIWLTFSMEERITLFLLKNHLSFNIYYHQHIAWISNFDPLIVYSQFSMCRHH